MDELHFECIWKHNVEAEKHGHQPQGKDNNWAVNGPLPHSVAARWNCSYWLTCELYYRQLEAHNLYSSVCITTAVVTSSFNTNFTKLLYTRKHVIVPLYVILYVIYICYIKTLLSQTPMHLW